MISQPSANESLLRPPAPPEDEITLKVRSRRVFKPRIWLGVAIIRIGFRIAGCRGEAL